MKATDLWNHKALQLFAERGKLTRDIEQKKKRLQVVDDQLAALDTTLDLAKGLDAQAEAAARTPDPGHEDPSSAPTQPGSGSDSDPVR